MVTMMMQRIFFHYNIFINNIIFYHNKHTLNIAILPNVAPGSVLKARLSSYIFRQCHLFLTHDLSSYIISQSGISFLSNSSKSLGFWTPGRFASFRNFNFLNLRRCLRPFSVTFPLSLNSNHSNRSYKKRYNLCVKIGSERARSPNRFNITL